MKILLHIGPHKTGTTSLQVFLNQNRTALREQGVLLPEIQGLDGTPNNWFLVYIGFATDQRSAAYHYSIRGSHDASTCADFRQRYTRELRNSLNQAKQLEETQGRAITYVLTSEELGFLDNQEMNRFYEILLEYSEHIDVLYYYRSPLSRLRSDIQQSSKAGVIIQQSHLRSIGVQDLPRLRKLLPQSPNDHKVKLIVKAYLRDLPEYRGWDVREDFCQLLGIDISSLIIRAEDPGANQSISLQMFSILQDVNRLMPATPGPNQQFNRLRRYWHLAVEAYRWTKLDTPLRLSRQDFSELEKDFPAYHDTLAFCSREPSILLDPTCQLVLNQLQAEAENYEPAASSSISDYKPELPRDYYINLLCHFWSFLIRRMESQKAAARPST